MDIKKLDRTALKSYFVKNAVPTESNFAELIDAMLNQKEDGIAKLAGEPLSIQADGNDSSQKKAINFYKSFADLKPAWTVSLNPRVDPNTPATAKPGWSLGDADGNSKLFIDQNTGNLGIGTVTPAVKLDVSGAMNVNGAANVNGALKVLFTANATRDPDSQLQSGGSLVLKGNAPQIDFLDTDHKDWAIHVNSNKMYFIREPWIFTDLVLDGAGNIGVGTDAPRAKLEVRGGAIMPSAGNLATAGIQFPSDPGGGAGDNAWIRFYPRTGEACTLELGVSNDGDDHIALMPSGGVGIGINEPAGKLHVQTGGTPPWDKFVVNTTTHWGDGPGFQYVTIGEGGAAGIMFYNPHVVWYAPEARASIRMGRSGGVGGGHWWDIGVRAGNAFSIFDGSNGNLGLSIADNSTVKVNILQLGDKWLFSAIGDWFTNDDWLRMQGVGMNNYFGGFAAGRLWTAQGVLAGSDLRLKTDVSPLRQAPEDILKLRAVRFRWRDAADAGEVMGLVAQEVEAVFPEVVSTGPDGMKGINYSALIAPLIELVKHQHVQIGELRARIDARREH
jgi:hypothetical protein